MTRHEEQLTISERVVVFFDICSSTSILEDLLLTNNVAQWRNLLIDVKTFMENRANSTGLEIYKFVGDGWVLLFPSSIDALELVDFFEALSGLFKTSFETLVVPRLEHLPKVTGITFGVDKGPLIRLEMLEQTEYLGRSLNVAARLQGAAKESSRPAYNVLFSTPTFHALMNPHRRLSVPPQSWKIVEEERVLRNIRGGTSCKCVRLLLTHALNQRGLEDMDSVHANDREPGGNFTEAAPSVAYALRPTFDKLLLANLLHEFRELYKSSDRKDLLSLADKLERDLLKRPAPSLQPSTLKQLAKWCSTSGLPYQRGMRVAREISMLLFGEIVDRQRLHV